MADWTGRKFGKIQIADLIARGGMAEVYIGTHETAGQVAVKVMRGLLERDQHQLARFQREAEVIGDLHHPNIVQMIDYFVEDETPCLVMEYISGPSLAAYMKMLHEHKQRIPIAVVAQILRSLASALDYAHSKGVVHRDIKPANVMLRSPSQHITIDSTLPLDVEPILMDFGLVRLVDSTMHTTTGSVSGTPAYMSPEQARGERVDYRTDIYSLGIMLYEMLAGAIPFQADTTFGMLMKHINEQPPPIKGLSGDMYVLLERALAKDPSMRYDSAGELANEFMALFNGQTISPGTLHIAEMARQAAEASKTTPQQVAQPPQRFRWARIAIESIAVIGLLALLFFQFVRPSGTTLVPSPVPVNPNIPIGNLRFADGNAILDSLSITLTKAELPATGKHYEAWLRYEDTTKLRDIGIVNFDASGSGQLVFTDPDQKNLLQGLNQIQITLEQNDVVISAPTGEVVFSSVLPSKALIPLGDLLVSHQGTPKADALIQGLYYYSGSYIDAPINGDKINDPNFVGLVQAYDAQNEAEFRKNLERIINQIVGDSSDQYLDYDKNGQPDVYSSDGFGSLPNGAHSGYLQATSLYAKNATDAEDSTPNIRQYGDNVQICVQNMDGWTNQILATALKLNEMPFGPEMKPTMDELSKLGDNLVNGLDTNGNGIVESIAGECGALTAYNNAYYMADMPLLPGKDRVPPSGK